ncbi:MAG: GNAT family N-acetyltransferase [Aeromicrobium sp.]|uniref:GNAT family N-acetyltransferase n=1 Tax=Aeromicrobium sp. TaxID=1871063 RepID=UPI0039E5F085
MSEPALTWPLSVPVLTDGEVVLRAHTSADLDAMTVMCQRPEASRYTTIPADYTREAAEDYALNVVPADWDAGRTRVWAVESPHGAGPSRFAGQISLGSGRAPEIGFILHPDARGRQVISNAVRLLVDWAFTEGGAEAVRWKAVVGNTASLRVAHACGFQLVAAVPSLLDHPAGVFDGWTAVLRFGEPPYPRTPWLEPVGLVGGGVRLRELRVSDAPRMAEACADPETRHWFANLPPAPTPAVAESMVHESVWLAARGEQLSWAVADEADDRLLGYLSVADLAHSRHTSGELAYWTHPDARGRGVMSAAVALAVGHAFDPDGLGLRRLSAAAAPGNAASLRIIERAGFTPTGRVTGVEPLGDGTWSDLLEFELLA